MGNSPGPPHAHRALLGRVWLLDAAIATGVLVTTLVVLAHDVTGAAGTDGHAVGSPGSLAVTLAVLGAVAVLVWRRRPLAAFVATVLIAMATVLLVEPLEVAPAPITALFLLASVRDPGASFTVRGLVIVTLFSGYLGALTVAIPDFGGLAGMLTALAWATAYLAGERVGLHHEQMTRWRDEARQAQRAAEQERRLAIAEERARIARDLHDSAGHAISVIAVRAGAARLGHHRDPQRSLIALQAIEELSRQAAHEIDQMVGTLRDRTGSDDVLMPVGLASLPSLLTHHKQAGRSLTVSTHGTPRPLPGMTDQAAYRIVQEALTNAARHGRGEANILVEYGDEQVALTVTNGVPTGSAQAASSNGHGVVGMRERAELVGGSLLAGMDGAGYLVRACLPYSGIRSRSDRDDEPAYGTEGSDHATSDHRR